MLTPIKPLQLELTPGQKKLLSVCRDEGPVSRARIAEVTGLRSGTVTSLSKELLAMNLIKEGNRVVVGRGQPIIPIELNPYAAFSFGIAFHIYRIDVALANFCGDIIDKMTFHYQEDDPVENVLEMIHQQVHKLIEKHRLQQARILGMGVSMPGPHKGNGVHIHTIRWLAHWREKDLAQMFGEQFEWPVWIDNDCNVAAVGEYYSGLWNGAKNMVVVEIGHGVGGGIIVNGKLHRGKHQNAGEIGSYFTYFSKGPRPSIRELMKSLEEAGTPIASIDDLPGLEHPVVAEWVKQAAIKLSPALMLTITWFDPDCVVIGGTCPAYLSEAIITEMDLEQYWEDSAHIYPLAPVSPSKVGKHLNAFGACMYPVFRTLGQ